jgi:soluble P-type ATPase
MPNQKISQLSAAAALDGSELVVVVQAGSNFKLTLAAFIDYIDATMITFTSATGGIVSVTVAGALRELQDEILALAASQIAFSSTTGGLIAQTVHAALIELQDEILDVDAALSSHLASGTAHSAENLSYSSATGGLLAQTVGAALRELHDEIIALTAEQVAFSSTTGGLIAQTVHAALRELQDEKVEKLGLEVKELGAGDDRQGLIALSGGTITVPTTAVTTTSRIFLTSNVVGGTPGALYVSARTPGTSFNITSTSGADTSSVAWIISEPTT